MAIADFATADRPVPSPFAGVIRALVRRWAARRESRAKKAALRSLLFAPEHHLRDIGITREAVVAAIKASRK